MTTTWSEEKWNALTDDDLKEIAGKKDRLVGKLQERYGYGKEQAQREAEELLRLHPEANGGPGPQTTETAQAPALPPPAHLESLPPAALTSLAPRAPVRPTENAPALTNPAAETPTDAGYAHSATVWISPRVLRWVAPVAVVAVFVLLFLPWTGVYPGGHRVYTQNAFQTIWGGVSVDPVGAEALDFVKPYDKVGANRLMVPYTLLVLVALVLVLAPLWLTPSRVQALRPIVRSLWRRRLGLLAAAALVAFVLLSIQLWTGFGLEAAVAARVDKTLASELAAAKTPAERQTAKIHRGLAVGPFSLGRTLWLRLAVFSHVLLLTGLGLELWLVSRGNRPLPRIDGHA
jgi:hypothetical protein